MFSGGQATILGVQHRVLVEGQVDIVAIMVGGRRILGGGSTTTRRVELRLLVKGQVHVATLVG